MIELLVVVGIVAILAAVTVTATMAALHAARRAKCLSNMRGIATSIMAYAGDHDSNFPLTDNPAWDVPLAPYDGSESTSAANPLLECPEDARPLVNGGGFARSYCFNAGLPAKTIQVASPGQTVLLAEWYSGGTSGPGGAGSNFQYHGNFDIVQYEPGFCPSATNSKGYHGTTSNFVFADGHAESLDPNVTTASPYVWQVMAQ